MVFPLNRITLLLFVILSITACSKKTSVGSADDTTAPTISSTTPAASANNVARNSSLTDTFNEDIFAITVNDSSFTLAKSGNINGTVSFDSVTNVATFTPSSELAVHASYTATLSTAITDLSGNALATNYSWSFTSAEGAWGTAELIETDNISDAVNPQVTFDGNGNGLAVWSQSDGNYFKIWANCFESGSLTKLN